MVISFLFVFFLVLLNDLLFFVAARPHNIQLPNYADSSASVCRLSTEPEAWEMCMWQQANFCTFLQILDFWRGENISGLFCQRTQIKLATLTWGQLPFSRRASLQIPRRGALWWTGFDLLVSPSPSCPTAQLRQDSAPCHGAGVPPRPACILTFSGHNEQITFLFCWNLRTWDFGIESSVPGWGSLGSQFDIGITSYNYTHYYMYTILYMYAYVTTKLAWYQVSTVVPALLFWNVQQYCNCEFENASTSSFYDRYQPNTQLGLASAQADQWSAQPFRLFEDSMLLLFSTSSNTNFWLSEFIEI